MRAAPFLAHAMSARYKRRVDDALQCVQEFAQLVKNPYIAFSMGKDSTVALHLTRKIMPECKAIYIDANCAFPEAYELLEKTPNSEKFSTQEDFLDIFERMGGVDGGRELEKETMQSTVITPVKKLVSMGYDGQILGLRADENHGRNMNFRLRGKIYWHKGYGVHICQPIADWSNNDVWGYIFSNKIEYCKVYDKMWDLPIEQQRTSYWAGETARRQGRWIWLRQNYPDLFAVLCTRFPEAGRYT